MVDDQAARRLLGRLANRIVKILAQTRKLNPPEK
jgi:ribosomal protein L13